MSWEGGIREVERGRCRSWSTKRGRETDAGRRLLPSVRTACTGQEDYRAGARPHALGRTVGGTQVVKKRAAVCNHTQLYMYHACLVARAVTAELAGLLLLVCAL